MCCDREKEFDAQVSCQILKIFEQHSNTYTQRHPVRKKCLYSELFWSAFSRIWTEYGEKRSISPNAEMRTRITLNMDTFYAVDHLLLPHIKHI